MPKRISELTELTAVDGEAGIPVALNGQNYRLSVGKILEQITAERVGLDHVDNTPDSEKPVSVHQQTALNGKANIIHTHSLADLPDLQAQVEDFVVDVLSDLPVTGNLSKTDW